MSYHFFALISRMKHIRRWGLMRNSDPENLSEHSHMTAVLAHALAVINRDVFGGDADPGQCAAAALFHDASEILTGDLPTPVKYFNPAIKDAYKAVEKVSANRIIAMLPKELQTEYTPLIREELPNDVYAIVKAADKLAAYIKCVEELRAGNAEFKKAAEQTRAALDAIELRELRYFLEKFIDSFELTLDELD